MGTIAKLAGFRFKRALNVTVLSGRSDGRLGAQQISRSCASRSSIFLLDGTVPGALEKPRSTDHRFRGLGLGEVEAVRCRATWSARGNLQTGGEIIGSIRALD